MSASDPYAEFEPPAAEILKTVRTRKSRAHQRRCRSDKHSHADEAENMLMLLAWEAGEISEGVMADVFTTDRVALRELRLRSIARGRMLAQALRFTSPAKPRKTKRHPAH